MDTTPEDIEDAFGIGNYIAIKLYGESENTYIITSYIGPYNDRYTFYRVTLDNDYDVDIGFNERTSEYMFRDRQNVWIPIEYIEIGDDDITIFSYRDPMLYLDIPDVDTTDYTPGDFNF